MAAIAIELDQSIELPSALQTVRTWRTRRRSRARNHGRFASKTVRQRNAEAGKPWWQPSSASFRVRSSRSRALASELREELYATALSPEEFWANPDQDVEDYLAERVTEEAAEIEERHHVILDRIEGELRTAAREIIDHQACDKLAKLVTGLRSDLAVASSPREIAELRRRLGAAQLRLELTQNDLLVLGQYADAA